MFSCKLFNRVHTWADSEVGEGWANRSRTPSSPPPPRKSQVAIGFRRNTGMDPFGLIAGIWKQLEYLILEIYSCHGNTKVYAKHMYTTFGGHFLLTLYTKHV